MANLYDWMVKYTPQTEWIEHKGILVWITEVLTAIGAGLFLVALFYNSLVGILAAWLLIVVIDIPLHLADYGKPFRFWRTIAPFSTAWKTSWFSRGVTFTVLFSGFGFLPILFLWGPSADILTGWFGGAFGTLDVIFKVIAAITGVLVLIYNGFIMSYCRSIPFWNSALLPIMNAMTGLTDGFFAMLLVVILGGQGNLAVVETGSSAILITSVIIMAIFLWTQTYTSPTAKYSVLQTVRGNLAPVFWIGVVGFGAAIPLVIAGYHLAAANLSTPLLVIAIICRLIGAVSLKYSLLRGGLYEPLVPSQATALTATPR